MLVLDWISHNIILFNMVVWQVMKIPIYSEYNACNIAYIEYFAILFTFLHVILAFLSLSRAFQEKFLPMQILESERLIKISSLKLDI